MHIYCPIQELPYLLLVGGGTSILFNAIAIGIILSVSAYVENRETTTQVESPTNKKSKKKIVDEIHG
jgi:hypothetical protein